MKVKKMLIGLLLITIGIIIDQVTKYASFKYLEFGPEYKCIPGLFKFSLVRNTGAAWGIFSNQIWVLIIITIIALGFMSYLAKDFDLKENPIFSASFILIVIGTIGNFIDRVYLGYVRDFVTFDFFSFPSFNFADMCLSIGVFFLTIDILFGETGVKWNK